MSNVLTLVAARQIICPTCNRLIGLDSTGKPEHGTILIRDRDVIMIAGELDTYYCNDKCAAGAKS